MMTIDKHTVALVSIVGSALDVLGALYLAYDLLGGDHGACCATLTLRGHLRNALFWNRLRSTSLGPFLWSGERGSARHHARLGVLARFS